MELVGEEDDGVLRLSDFKDSISETGLNEDQIYDLIGKVFEACPKNDVLKFDTRIKKLDWDKISCAGATTEECKKAFDWMMKKVRKHRTLPEVLADMNSVVADPTWWMDELKKPVNAFSRYTKKRYKKILKKNPTLALPQISKAISEEWEHLDAEKKEKYQTQYKIEMVEYKRLSKERVKMKRKFTNSLNKANASAAKPTMNGHVEQTDATKLSNSKALNANAPAEPASGVDLYVRFKLDEDPSASKQDLVAHWPNMKRKTRVAYMDQAFRDFDKYLVDLKKFKKLNPEFKLIRSPERLHSSEDWKIWREKKNLQIPPLTGWQLFIQSGRDSGAPHLTFKENTDLFRQLSTQWRSMSKEDKEQWNKTSREAAQQYKLNLAEYLNSLPDEQREGAIIRLQPSTGLMFQALGFDSKKKTKKRKLSTVVETPVKLESDEKKIKVESV